jgi:hypothetical protein
MAWRGGGSIGWRRWHGVFSCVGDSSLPWWHVCDSSIIAKMALPLPLFAYLILLLMKE